jgi:HEAT repeat protein
VRRAARLLALAALAACSKAKVPPPESEARPARAGKAPAVAPSPFDAEREAAVREALRRIRVGVPPDQAFALEDEIVRAGAGALPLLDEAITDGDDEVRFHAARALARLRSPAARPLLLRAVKDRHAGVRIVATEALAEATDRDDPAQVSELLSLLVNDPEPVVRNAAAFALHRIGWRSGVPALVENLGARAWARWDADRKLREIAGIEVGFEAHAPLAEREAAARRWREWQAGYSPLYDDLVRSLGVYKFLVADHAKKTLVKLGAASIPRVRRGLLDPLPAVRVHCAEILGLAGATEAMAELRARLADPISTVRVAAAAALGLLRDPDPDAGLARAALEDPDPNVRCAAVAALAELRSEAAIAPLARALERDRRVSEIAASAREGLRAAGRAARIGETIADLSAPGPAARAAARQRLQRLFGDAVPADPAAWWREIDAREP